MLKIVINCGLAEEFIGRCIASVRRQTLQDWQAFVTVDCDGDATYERAIDAAAGDARVHVTRNRRRLFAMHNVVRAIERGGAEDEDVIVNLDGDDWLIEERALELIAATYAREGCWITYGSWISNRPGVPGPWPAYPDGTRDFRATQWLGTAVRTWKKWLWDLIDDADLRDTDGEYVRVAEDVAYFMPMLEMSTTARARHIAQPLMFYNWLTPRGEWPRADEARVVRDLRARTPYAPLDSQTFEPARLSSWR